MDYLTEEQVAGIIDDEKCWGNESVVDAVTGIARRLGYISEEQTLEITGLEVMVSEM